MKHLLSGVRCLLVFSLVAQASISKQLDSPWPRDPNGPTPIAFQQAKTLVPPIITLAAVGDVLLHTTLQQWAAKQPEGFYHLFQPVADLLQSADVAVANLEGPAAQGVTVDRLLRRASPLSRYDAQVFTGYPRFNYHPSIVATLKRVGFRVLLTANNHALDRGALGVDKTLEAIQSQNLSWTGTRQRGAATPWYTVTPVTTPTGRYQIAWLGCACSTNGLPDRYHQVLHCHDQASVIVRILHTLSKRPDIHAIIMLPHWGQEYHHYPDQPHRALAKAFIAAGATAIIGTHPHVIQPFEHLQAPDGREAFVAWSLGNFVSGQIGLARRSTALLLLQLARSPNGKLAPYRVGWMPLRMTAQGGWRVEAVDRVGHSASLHRAHLLKYLPAANQLPPVVPFQWPAGSD